MSISLREVLQKKCLQADPGMVLVQMLVGLSQADRGPFRWIPDSIDPGGATQPGDVVELDPDTAARWSAAGMCSPYVPPETPPP